MPQNILTRPKASEYLNEKYGPLGGRSVSWLEKAALHGGGPPFIRIGRKIGYIPEDLDQWVESSIRRHLSTSEYATRAKPENGGKAVATAAAAAAVSEAQIRAPRQRHAPQPAASSPTTHGAARRRPPNRPPAAGHSGQERPAAPAPRNGRRRSGDPARSAPTRPYSARPPRRL
jgi:hypothetical protein